MLVLVFQHANTVFQDFTYLIQLVLSIWDLSFKIKKNIFDYYYKKFIKIYILKYSVITQVGFNFISSQYIFSFKIQLLI